MKKYQEKVYDASTNQINFFDYSDQQIKENEQLTKELLVRLKNDEEKIEKRKSALAKLAALGLTEEEIAAL